MQAHPEHQTDEEHMQQMMRMHRMTQWTQFLIMALGLWLIASPWTLGSLDPANFGPRVAEVTAERGLADPLQRARWLAWSDRASGALLLVFGALALLWRHRWAQWGSCFVGLWLLAAPLLFWVPDAATYANETLVAALVITLSILVPMMPGMSHAAMMQAQDIPPGWAYSPSTWSQRLPIIALALPAFLIARYLSAYQLGHIGSVWDPFFGDGTRYIITSRVSKAWPVPDAGLGAMSYLLEALSGAMGDRRRWRTMPWMVGMFGVLVIPLGAVSIYFIVIQPIVLGTWCTLCLVSAALMVFMLPYTFDEIVAMGQFLVQARREGRSLWSTFWHGGAMAGCTATGEPPLLIDRPHLAALSAQAAALPKGLVLCALLGLWLMFTRVIFGTQGPMADSDHLVGALVFVVSVSAFAEVARPLRGLNFLAGAWLLAAPWLLEGASFTATLASIAVGVALVALSVPRGRVRHRYGSWDRLLIW